MVTSSPGRMVFLAFRVNPYPGENTTRAFGVQSWFKMLAMTYTALEQFPLTLNALQSKIQRSFVISDSSTGEMMLLLANNIAIFWASDSIAFVRIHSECPVPSTEDCKLRTSCQSSGLFSLNDNARKMFIQLRSSNEFKNPDSKALRIIAHSASCISTLSFWQFIVHKSN